MNATQAMIDATMKSLDAPKKQPMRIIKKATMLFSVNHMEWIDKCIKAKNDEAKVEVMRLFIYHVLSTIGSYTESPDKNIYSKVLYFIKQCDETMLYMQKGMRFHGVMSPIGSLLRYVIIQDEVKRRRRGNAENFCKMFGWDFKKCAVPESFADKAKGLEYLPFVLNYHISDSSDLIEPYSYCALFELKSCFSIGDRFKSGKSTYTLEYWCGEKGLFALKRDGEKNVAWYRSESDLKKWEKC